MFTIPCECRASTRLSGHPGQAALLPSAFLL